MNYQFKNEEKKFNIAGLSIANLTYQDVLDYFQKKIELKEKAFCVTLNIDIFRLAYQNKEFLDIINSADLVFADGMPLIWLSQLRKHPLKQRIAGRKIVVDLCKIAAKKNYKVFMLGAAEGVAETAKARLEKSMQGIQIAGTYSPSPQELADLAKNSEIIKQINDSGADILFVALGAPKQEMWIYNNLDRLNPYIYIPCGGSIDFIAGVQPKSPEWLGDIGLEWLYRLIRNPRRMFKRYIILNLPFLIQLFAINFKKDIKA